MAGETTSAIVAKTLSWHDADATKLLRPPDAKAALIAESVLWQGITNRASSVVGVAMMNPFGKRPYPYDSLSQERAERLLEIMGLMGAIGEQAGLAWTAHQDVQRFIMTASTRDAEHQCLAVRAMSETVGHFLLGCVHSLANLVLRVLLLNADAAVVLNCKHKNAKGFMPGPDLRGAWRTLNSELVTILRSAGEASKSDELKLMPNFIHVLLESREFQALDGRRGMDYHRRRPQSVRHAAPSRGTTQPLGSHSAFTIGDPRADPDADPEAVFASVDQAIAPVTDAMVGIADTLGEALRGQRIEFTEDSDWRTERAENLMSADKMWELDGDQSDSVAG